MLKAQTVRNGIPDPQHSEFSRARRGVADVVRDAKDEVTDAYAVNAFADRINRPGNVEADTARRW